MVVRYLERGIKAVDAQKLSAPITKNPDKSFIIQVHGRNLEVADALIDSGVGCSVLFDAPAEEGSGQPGGRSVAANLPRADMPADLDLITSVSKPASSSLAP